MEPESIHIDTNPNDFYIHLRRFILEDFPKLTPLPPLTLKEKGQENLQRFVLTRDDDPIVVIDILPIIRDRLGIRLYRLHPHDSMFCSEFYKWISTVYGLDLQDKAYEAILSAATDLFILEEIDFTEQKISEGDAFMKQYDTPEAKAGRQAFADHILNKPGPLSFEDLIPPEILTKGNSLDEAGESSEAIDKKPDGIDPTALRQFITDHFSLEEIRTLAEDCGIDYEELGQLPKEPLIRELIRELVRRKQLPALIHLVHKRRPNLFEKQFGGSTLTNISEALALDISSKISPSSSIDPAIIVRSEASTLSSTVLDEQQKDVTSQESATRSKLDWKWITGFVVAALACLGTWLAVPGIPNPFQNTATPSAATTDSCEIRTSGLSVEKLVVEKGESIQVSIRVNNPEGRAVLFDWQAVNGQMTPGLRTNESRSTYTPPLKELDDTISVKVTMSDCDEAIYSKQISVISKSLPTLVPTNTLLSAGSVTPTAMVVPTETSSLQPTPREELQVSFSAEKDVIDLGDCTTIKWDVENADKIFLQGGEFADEGVDGHDSRLVCPAITTTYVLDIEVNGKSQSFEKIVELRTELPPGKIAFTSDRGGQGWRIFVIDLTTGKITQITDGANKDSLPVNDWDPSWSPDGSTIVFESGREGEFDIFTIASATGNFNRLTTDSTQNLVPVWSPKGDRIAFQSIRSANFDIYLMSPEGANVQRLTDHDGPDMWPGWSPDGQQIVFESQRNANNKSGVYILNISNGESKPLLADDWDNGQPTWSKKDKIAFYSDRDGNKEIYTIGQNGANLKRITFNEAEDWFPAWSPDGNWLAFTSSRDGNLEIYVTDLEGQHLVRITDNEAQDRDPAWFGN